MTDQHMRDLLHESVRDVSGPDFADAAWQSAVRARRRRRTAVAAVGVVAVTGVAGGLFALGHRPSVLGPASQRPGQHPSQLVTTPAPSPSPGPSTYQPAQARPDARYGGWPVWWAPSLADEQGLPGYPGSPLPATIDLSQVSGSLAQHPLSRAVAAFGVSTADGGLAAVDVMGADGRLWSLDASRVQPMTDPAGGRRVRVGPSLLSRTGEYLLFPQESSVLLYTVRTGEWRTIDTGTTRTWDATWVSDRDFVLPDPSRPSAPAVMYSVDGQTSGSTNVIASGLPDIPIGASQVYGRARTGHDVIAQAFTSGAQVPEPPHGAAAPGGSPWLAVSGSERGILLVPAEPGRGRGCCEVEGWIAPRTVTYSSPSPAGVRVIAWQVGTGRFWQVSQLTGSGPGQETVESAFAQLPAALAPNPR